MIEEQSCEVVSTVNEIDLIVVLKVTLFIANLAILNIQYNIVVYKRDFENEIMILGQLHFRNQPRFAVKMYFRAHSSY